MWMSDNFLASDTDTQNIGIKIRPEWITNRWYLLAKFDDKIDFVLDKEKAALHGVSSEDVARILRLALSGESPANVHDERERQPLPVKLILPRFARSTTAALSEIPIKSASGEMVPLAELGQFVHRSQDQPIYHKNLRRVVFVYGEMAGPSPVEAVLDIKRKLEQLSPFNQIR